MDFEDLSNETQLKTNILNVHNSINQIKQVLNELQTNFDYEKMDTMDKVNYDTFLCYALNTLYWIYLRTRGVDSNEHVVRRELNRIQEYMFRTKKAKERLLPRPKIDEAASKRIINHALTGDIHQTKNKITKFS